MTGAKDDAWKDRAECRPGLPGALAPDLFFPPKGVPVPAPVKAMCARCPVQAECLAFAGTEQGVWGGLSGKERRAWRRRRRAEAG